MTILQNAYNAYLTKKYEKEINKFKELALTVIKEAEIKLKDDLYESTVLFDNKRDAEKSTKDLLNLIDIKRLINTEVLQFESGLFNKRYIDILVDEYNKLNNLIVEGESKFIVFNSVEPIQEETIVEEDAVSKLIDTLFEEARKILDERLNEIDKQNKYYIDITFNGCEASAKQFATSIMNEMRTKKAGKI